MKKLLGNLAVISLISVLVSSCEADPMWEGDNNMQQPTRLELLTNNTWQVKDVRAGGVSVLPVITRLQCITDNVLTFNTDGSFVIDEGADVCSPRFAGSGTWSLVKNDTEIKWNFTSPQEREVFVPILELTPFRLRITYTFGEEVPYPGQYEMILERP